MVQFSSKLSHFSWMNSDRYQFGAKPIIVLGQFEPSLISNCCMLHQKGNCWIIAYRKLAELSGFSNYDSFQKSHYEYVAESLHNDVPKQSWWSESIAVGDESFVDNIKQHLGLRAKGRKVKETGEGFQLREDDGAYISDFDLKNRYIGSFHTFSAGDNYVNTEL